MGRFTLPKEEDQHPVDLAALREFAAGADEHRTKEGPPPWEQHDPEGLPKHNVSVRLNDYHLEMLRYLAQRQDRSQQKVMRDILIPAIEEAAKDLRGL